MRSSWLIAGTSLIHFGRKSGRLRLLSTPPIGWTFLHTDGAVNVGSGIGAIGGLFHDYVGSWISGFGRSISISDVLTVELWVIHDSLELAWNNGFLNL
ncbi:hypothetical protein V6N12_017765 [Hibiscus sabdariffa]|uniref:RNase H type-1 domain-containing protein n=1 Tax=Hibiscus sabdariffa TaxID=183260 RepID=A0ABR2BBH8_9ROSI